MRFNFQLAQTIEDLKRLLETGVQRLRLDENFINFVVTVTIPNGQTVEIPNKLKNVPSKRIILKQTGNGFVTDADTPWTRDSLYLINNGPADTTITVMFLE